VTVSRSRAPGLAIRWRLTIWITLAFIATMVAIFIALRLVLSQVLYRDVNSDLAANLRQVEAGIGIDQGGTDLGNLEAVATRYSFPIVFRDPNGSALFANAAADDRGTTLSDSDVVGITVEGHSVDSSDELHGEAFRVLSTRFKQPATGAVLIIQVGRSTQSIDDTIHVLDLILLSGGGGAALVVLAVGYWLARNAVRPVERITKTAAEIQASDMTRRIGASGQPIEVQRLADTFDDMLARLESAFAQQRNFVMDVSHELRTPLTSLKANVDVMLMDKGLDLEVRTQLERMNSEVGRLIRLTSNLLYLAHAEAGREIARRPVELDELCLDVIYQARNLRDEVAVRFGHEEQVTVSGDRDLLKQLVLNLVDNAVKYSPEGGDVTVSLYERGEAAEIAVADNGPGIPPDELDKIFERFYRVANQRTRTVGGAGIGLAISKWIARAHGGDIRVESSDGAGARFIVTLPLIREETKAPA
jgi:two-component system OmpR family sensor kinase